MIAKMIAILALPFALHSADTTADIYLLGVSRHTQGDYQGDYREVNPGLGFGISKQIRDHVDGVVAGVTYKDSYNLRAVAIMAGARLIAGDRDGMHASFALMAGTLQGSGHNGLAAIPVLACGYGPVSLEAAMMGPEAIGAWLRISIPLTE